MDRLSLISIAEADPTNPKATNVAIILFFIVCLFVCLFINDPFRKKRMILLFQNYEKCQYLEVLMKLMNDCHLNGLSNETDLPLKKFTNPFSSLPSASRSPW